MTGNGGFTSDAAGDLRSGIRRVFSACRAVVGERFEGLGQFQGSRVAVVGRLFHRPRDDRGEPLRHRRGEVPHRLGFAELMAEQLLRQPHAGEGNLAGQHMVKCAAERVDVAPRIDRVRVPGLFGRDIIKGADRRPVASHPIVVAEVDGQAEVGQLGDPVVRDKDVVRVDVAVDQPFALGVLQTEGHLPDEPRGVARGQRARLADHLADVLPLNVLHHEVTFTGRLALIVNPHEVLVLKLGADHRLAVEPGDRPRVVHPLRREDLERHPTVQLRVPREVDPTHPPLADQLEEDVAVDLEAGGPTRKQLLGLPDSHHSRLHGLTSEPAVDVLGRALLGGDRVPAGLERLGVRQAALERRLPKPTRRGLEHGLP